MSFESSAYTNDATVTAYDQVDQVQDIILTEHQE